MAENKKEYIVVSSKPLDVSQKKNYKLATFLISVLDEYNANGAMIQKAEGEKYIDTLKGMPLLAYLKYDQNTGKPQDFGGHEVRIRRNEDGGEEYYFATTAIGSIMRAWIEKREVDGYSGLKDVILIEAKLWTTRYPEYFRVLDKLWEKGGVTSSWEISPEEIEYTASGRILKVFEWIGNTVLGSNVMPAVHGAGMLEYSESGSFTELSDALKKDLDNTKPNKEENKVENETVKMLAEKESKINELTKANSELETSNKALADKVDEFENKISELTKEVSEKEEALVKASEKVTNLEKEVSELTPFKEKVEEIEEAEKQKEIAEKKEQLKSTLEKSVLIKAEEFESSEEIKDIIENVDEAKANSLISKRFMDQKLKAEPETSETKVTKKTNASANLKDTEEEVEDLSSIISNFLKL